MSTSSSTSRDSDNQDESNESSLHHVGDSATDSFKQFHLFIPATAGES